MPQYPNYSQMINPYQQMTYPQFNSPYMERTNYMQQYQQNLQPVQQQSVPVQTQQPMGIAGRTVQSVEQITANEVPMDGSLAFFPKQDMTEIYAKQWNADGTIKTVIYRPVMDNAVNSHGNNRNQQITIPDEVTKAFMDRFDELSGKIEQLENSMTNSMTKSMTNARKATTKKDGDLND